ncbi:MAG: hypothetical protein V7776_12070 [Halopseudomonas aestusnigri]
MMLELHFQEGFDGEDIEIIVGNRVVTRLKLRTRMQTGLAHIEKLMPFEDEARQEVQIAIAELGQICCIKAADNDTVYEVGKSEPEFVLVNLQDGKLTFQTTYTAPGYL